ncbi:oxidoreductase [Dictyobacter aurantiacus]|uniref:Oxidoreductase n=1 Tax=Dictyobacter aurantiacus TaxID=1936993 RepID=A0A401ZMU6_9CHLR|nr:oxidoreductase [Dictyobacter aurantiacus]GCE08201.1 oxidoreductase [Dictyobacter aurantiacus]
MNHWTVNDIPDLRGRIALVTGANRGLGLEETRALAQHGAHVIMAVRNLKQGQLAEAEIKQTVPDASLEVMSLDLSSLASVREFAARVLQTHQRLDLLLNNAGLTALPQRQETQDGFEMQFGTNHLGHFALTGLLVPRLLTTPGSRVVTMTSNGRRTAAHLDFDDLQSQRSYSRWGAYGKSKRANLLFAFELQTRFTEAGVGTISVAAHPGGANTSKGGSWDHLSPFERFFFGLFSQSASMGALPLLYAATHEHITGGELVGPGGFANSIGYPKVDRHASNEYDHPAAARLWKVSEELTGVTYDALRQRVEA